MTARESALLAYFATIAFDPNVVIAARSGALDKLFTAVSNCLKEDLPAVALEVGRQAAAGVVRRAEPMAQDFLTDIFKRLDAALGGGRKADRGGKSRGGR